MEDIVIAADWIARALSASGYRADFTATSLSEVDLFFDENSVSGHPTTSGLLAQDTGTRLFALGGYVGEVVRRQLGGQWYAANDSPQAEIDIELHIPPRRVIWPVQRILKRLANGSEDSIVVYGRGLGLES